MFKKENKQKNVAIENRKICKKKKKTFVKNVLNFQTNTSRARSRIKYIYIVIETILQITYYNNLLVITIKRY